MYRFLIAAIFFYSCLTSALDVTSSNLKEAYTILYGVNHSAIVAHHQQCKTIVQSDVTERLKILRQTEVASNDIRRRWVWAALVIIRYFAPQFLDDEIPFNTLSIHE